MHNEERNLPHPSIGRKASRVSGYLVEWGKPSAPMLTADKTEYVEVFVKGCFARSIQREVPATVTVGGVAMSAGCKTQGNLRLAEDDTGLWYELAVPASTTPTAMLAAPKSRFVFALRNKQSDSWSTDKKTRTILDVDLNEVGLVI